MNVKLWCASENPSSQTIADKRSKSLKKRAMIPRDLLSQHGVSWKTWMYILNEVCILSFSKKTIPIIDPLINFPFNQKSHAVRNCLSVP